MNDCQEMQTVSVDLVEDDVYVTDGERRLLTYLNGDSGPFNKALFEVILHSDVLTLASLRKTFPEEVEAVQKYKNEPNYLTNLTTRLSAQQ